jgi:hypothetical protein
MASVTYYGMAKHATTVWAEAVCGEMSGEKDSCATVEICRSLPALVYVQINCLNIRCNDRITLCIYYLYASL